MLALPAEKPIDKRDRAIIGLLLYGFVPLSSLVELKIKDYKMENNQASLKIKIGEQEYWIPLHPNAITYLEDHIASASIKNDDQLIFSTMNKKKTSFTGRKLVGREILAMFQRKSEKANIHPHVTADRIRLTGITSFMQFNPQGRKDNLLTYRNIKTISEYEELAEGHDEDLSALWGDVSEISEPLKTFIEKTGIFQHDEIWPLVAPAGIEPALSD